MAGEQQPRVVCIGAGPAGLTAAYLLSKAGIPVTVLERDPDQVGGISRTVEKDGFRFDIGGHRFFSKAAEVEALWQEIIGDDFLSRPRKSRIYYRNKLFDYPLKARDALSKLGLIEAALCVLSYARARLGRRKAPKNFEEWVSSRFGRRLFRIFFKTYTEKVWGMACTDISADWAAQRIKGLSLGRAILHAVLPKRPAARATTIKTLIDRFNYPRLGPGMMWDAAAARVRERGGQVVLGMGVTRIARTDAGWTVTARDAAGAERDFQADHVISSAPIRELFAGLQPPPPAAGMRAAQALRYRDFLTVALFVRDRDQFDDNWIYVHSPEVKVGRIQNFKSWSPELVPEAALNCFGLEYFCFAGDALWTMPDDDLVALATQEMVALKLAERADIQGGCVIRQPKAYPIYDEGYAEQIAAVRDTLARHYPGLHLVGRNGMHKYNNQDHAMMTAMLVARNIIAGRPVFDPWLVNSDAEYHETGETTVPGGTVAAGPATPAEAVPVGGAMAGAVRRPAMA